MNNIPELTDDHKTAVLMAQRTILNIHNKVQQAQLVIAQGKEELETANASFQKVLNQLVTDLGVDTQTTTFDLENLKLVPKATEQALQQAV